MSVKFDKGFKSFLNISKLPQEFITQQAVIERAEEDLLCAVSLHRRGACGYSPFVTICFLLHQAMEKWLKAFIAVQGIQVSAKGQHDLYSRFEAAESQAPQFESIRKIIEEVAPEILDHKFPGNLRYNETPTDIERYIEVLITATFAVRRLVKQQLEKLKEYSDESS